MGFRNNTIRARVAFPLTSTPAGINLASAIGPSAITSAGHWTLSGSLGDIRGISSTATSSVEILADHLRSIGS